MHIEEIQIPTPHALMEDYLFHFERLSSFLRILPIRRRVGKREFLGWRAILWPIEKN